MKNENKFKISFTLISITIICSLLVVIGCLVGYIISMDNFREQIIGDFENIVDNLREQNEELRNNYKIFTQAQEISEMYDEYYVRELDANISEEMARAYIDATGDKYGEYYTPEEWKDFSSTLNGESYGIGILVHYEDQILTVLDCYENTSAWEVGIRPGDKILGTDSVDFTTITYNEILALIKGDKGTTVTLRIKRNEEEFVVTPTRNDFEVKTVRLRYIEEEDKKIAYVKITNFYNNTTADFKEALDEINNNNCDGIIFDLRDNGGGTLSSVTKMLDYLLPEGVIVHINYKSSESSNDIMSDSEVVIDLPMVVLINSSTASAAELFTSSLKDYDKVQIVGVKSYGKGCGQTMYELQSGGTIKLTTFFYDPPTSENYDGIGITPDYEVEIPEEYKSTSLYMIGDENDTQLQKGLELLTE